MELYIGADHRGFAMKEGLSAWLREQGHDVHDMGAMDYIDTDDYPDYALPVAQKVGRNPETLGILLCGSGAGMAVIANKVSGVRAALIHDIHIAKAARHDDNINVLALGADYISIEQAKEVIAIFLATPFSSEERYARRVGKIESV